MAGVECTNTTCDNYNESCPWNCSEGSRCIQTARDVLKASKQPSGYNEETEVDALKRELKIAKQDLEQLRKNCFTVAEVELCLKQTLETLRSLK